jgi:hypothetical protein
VLTKACGFYASSLVVRTSAAQNKKYHKLFTMPKGGGKNSTKEAVASAARPRDDGKSSKQRLMRSPKPKKSTGSRSQRVYVYGSQLAFHGFMQKARSDAESYSRPVQAVFRNDSDAYEDWQVTDLVFRRAADGTDRVMDQSGHGVVGENSYGFRQFVWVPPEGVQNTHEERERWGRHLVSKLNQLGSDTKPGNPDYFDYVTKFEYMGDISSAPLLTVDRYVTDRETVSLARQAYHGVDLQTMLTHDEVIGYLFHDVEHGKQVLSDYW